MLEFTTNRFLNFTKAELLSHTYEEQEKITEFIFSQEYHIHNKFYNKHYAYWRPRPLINKVFENRSILNYDLKGYHFYSCKFINCSIENCNLDFCEFLNCQFLGNCPISDISSYSVIYSKFHECYFEKLQMNSPYYYKKIKNGYCEWPINSDIIYEYDIDKSLETLLKCLFRYYHLPFNSYESKIDDVLKQMKSENHEKILNSFLVYYNKLETYPYYI